MRNNCAINVKTFYRILFLVFIFTTSSLYSQNTQDVVNLLGGMLKRGIEVKIERNKEKRIKEREIAKKDSIIKQKIDFENSYKFEKIHGLYGCDATALFKDSHGNLWLGTGSSGGMYRYNTALHSWEEKNNGIGAVHVYSITEIENKIFISYLESKERKKYAYFDSVKEKWLDLSSSQEVYIINQFDDQNRKRKTEVFTYLLDNKEKLGKIPFDKTYLRDIVVVDNKLFILDIRGLFYIDITAKEEDRWKIKEFNNTGLEATDILQIIPHRNKIIVWTNSQKLYSYDLSSKNWNLIIDTPYDIRLNIEMERNRTIDWGNLSIENVYKEVSDKYYHREYNFPEKGIVHISEDGKIALSIHGELITSQISNPEKVELYENKEGFEFYEAIYGSDGSIFARDLGKIIKINEDGSNKLLKELNSHDFNNGYYYRHGYARPVFSSTKDGKVMFDETPLFFDDGSKKIMSSKYSNVANYFEVLDDKNKYGKLIIKNTEYNSCGESSYSEYLGLNYMSNVILYPDNPKFTNVFYSDDSHYYIGTAGSGLLLLNVK